MSMKILSGSRKLFGIWEREITQDIVEARQILFHDVWINAAWKRGEENDEDRE